MNTIYNKYKERLIEVSGRNKNLYLRNITKKYNYDLGKVFEHLKCYNEFNNFLWQKKNYLTVINEKIACQYCKIAYEIRKEVIDDKDFLSKQLNWLKVLKREIEELEKETGQYELYIGYPFVVGNINKDIQINAPLLFFPVEIIMEKNIAKLKIIPQQPVSLNKNFILAYAKNNGLKTENLTQEFDLPNEKLANINDIINYLNHNDYKIKHTRKSSIYAFENNKNNLVEDNLRIEHFAVLGRFPTANSIYNDYLKLEKDNLSTPALEMLLKGKSLPTQKRKQKHYSLPTYAIHDLDYTQENAIEQINRHDNIVIYGPPGTGKSQTIVNIISDALCKDKKILVVSQKKVALDVVFSRLGVLSSKAMLISHPEMEKSNFFDRVKQAHSQTLDINSSDNQKRYDINQLNITQELTALDAINSTLFSKTNFGLSLQEMYAQSYNIGNNTKDYRLYKNIQKTAIINQDYNELQENLSLIKDKKLSHLFYNSLKLFKENPIAKHIRTDLDMHNIKEAYSSINKLISAPSPAFNLSDYPYGRYLLTFYLENITNNRKTIAQIADIITKLSHPSLTKWISVSTLPIFWILYPILKIKFNTLSTNIMIDLNVTKHALDLFSKKYEIFKNILSAEGYASIIGSLAYGNTECLKNIIYALENYITIRDMHCQLDSLSDKIYEILYFAFDNSNKTIESLEDNIEKIMPIRIYCEIIKNSKDIEENLSKTVMFESLRERILNLKAQQRELTKSIATERFSDKYNNYYSKSLYAKDFLYQIQKQRGHWSIRKMIEYFEGYLLQLFPCWLLSPQTVSTILPLKKGMFDYVIFDEASQIFVESSIPAIYRGNKIIVAGDNKQLRPTSGFVRRYLGDDSFDYHMDLSTQAALEVESLLDLATAKYHPVHLSYHYRSSSAELINFSNTAFYENQLKIAPNIYRNCKNPPIERIKVNGQWENRCNHQEAVAVIELIKKIINDKNLNSSIGVVTFNIEQKEYIEELIDKEIEKSVAFRRRYMKELNRNNNGENQSVFVKNLENVQGDQRDIIIFSVGYAKNTHNKVSARFGSLSMSGGENRLNVAITRAKRKVYVVTSIEPEDLTSVDTAKNEGPKLLKKYLQYARAVSQSQENEMKQILSTFTHNQNINHTAFRYEEEIKLELEKLGYVAHTNLGNSDYQISIGIFDMELQQYILGIECDYNAFISSKNILERDIYRIHFLEKKGWKIFRVWSRDWWQSKEKVIGNIVQVAQEQKQKLLKNVICLTNKKECP